MTQSISEPQSVRSADALHALLEAHAKTCTAYGQLLLGEEPPSRKGLQRARSLVTKANGRVPNNVIATACQTMMAVQEIPYIDLKHYVVPPEVAKLLPRSIAERFHVVPVTEWNDHIVLAVSRWPDEDAMNLLRFVLQRHFVFVRASRSEIEETVAKLYLSETEAQELRALNEMALEQEANIGGFNQALADDVEKLAERAPIVNLVDSVLFTAVRLRASDVHLRPGKHEFEILYRIDGTLITVRTLRAALLPVVASRIKVLASLDITERRLPQDGRIQLAVADRSVDLRVSVIPVRYGESIVIRVLDKSAGLRSIDDIGFSPKDRDKLLDLIRRSYGIVLVTGPTGSGKTTTLYAALQAVRRENVNIVTAEDPIEYELAGVRQIQLLPQVNFGFPQALRHILRHDPDVIMVGEMRDLETCKIAVESALTGHLVFSTLHTNDAPSTLVRLLEIGIAPYMIRSAVIGVLAQRLVRRNCEHCKTPELVDEIARINLGLDTNEKFFRGSGCERCRYTGFSGRMAIYELMTMNDSLRKCIDHGVASDEFRKIAIDNGMTTLSANGVAQARKGHVSIAEIYRACM
jgi:type IV pilus assembly protein PilB